MTPLTPEQVALLRFPDWFELVPTRDVVKSIIPEGMLCRCEPWAGQTKDDSGDAFRAPKSEIALAQLAERCANGHLPPEALDDVWRRVEGKPSKEAELLRAVVESYDAAVQARHVQDTYHEPSTTPDDQYRAAVATLAADRFRGALSVARKWIEEQKP